MARTYEDAEIKRAVLGSARRRVLVASPAKLSRTSSFRFGTPADLTHLVTTDDAPDEVLHAFREQGVEVLLAAAPL